MKLPIIISSDKIKEEYPDYNPKKASLLHSKSAKEADKRLKKLLKSYDYVKKVIFLCGGSASGKTEFMSEYLADYQGIIVDGTLSNSEGVDIKFRNCLKFKKEIEVTIVIPDDLRRAFTAFLHRDRQFDDKHFYKTHSGSRKTIQWIIRKYPQVKIRTIESRYINDKIFFQEILFRNKDEQSTYFYFIQKTESEILDIINS